jgi:transposase
MNPATRLMVEKLTSLAAQGMTYEDAARETGTTYGYIAKYANRYDIPLRQKRRGRPATTYDPRGDDMRSMFLEGKTLQEIGRKYSITRERVRQILHKYFGFRAENGGKSTRVRKARQAFNKKRDARCQKHWGCSYKEYQRILKYPGRPTYAFSSQRKNAQHRGIGWELSLWSWWKIWENSGHWDDRGRGHGYGMCRHNDLGPYAADNVYIATGTENIQDYWADVKSGARPRPCVKRARLSPEQSKEALRAATRRYQQTPKYRLRLQLRRQGIPKDQRDAIVAEQFGASS